MKNCAMRQLRNSREREARETQANSRLRLRDRNGTMTRRNKHRLWVINTVDSESSGLPTTYVNDFLAILTLRTPLLASRKKKLKVNKILA